MNHNDKKEPSDDRERPVATPSFILSDGTIGEMIYDGIDTKFVVYLNGGWDIQNRVTADDGSTLVPYSATNNLVKHRVVQFPSDVTEYHDEQQLIQTVQAFIHQYIDVSPLYERLSSYYVLFSWLYDDFNELPYLRVMGDAGSGKTRFLLTIGSLCYKPIFASGASTVSPLFRVLDIFKGTLLIDEGDFPQSDEKAEIIKILNNGNAKGFPVLRSEPVGDKVKEYDPRAFHVFSPKIIGTRSLFNDRALESRCLTEEMGHRKIRADIPINLPDSFYDEATNLRNQLVLFRFRYKGRYTARPDLIDRTIEPRLNQIFIPLLSIIQDDATRDDLKDVLRSYHRQLVSDRGLAIEALILEVIASKLNQPTLPSIKEVAFQLAEEHEDEYRYKITPKWVGSVIRRKLHLKTERTRDGYVISLGEREKIEQLLVRYGFRDDSAETDDTADREGREHVNVPESPDRATTTETQQESGQKTQQVCPRGDSG